jgi:hypothetical protein
VSDRIGDNLALIVTALTDALRRGSTDALAVLLDEKVVWNGMFPDEISHNREEVLGALVRNRPGAPRISGIEAGGRPEVGGDCCAGHNLRQPALRSRRSNIVAVSSKKALCSVGSSDSLRACPRRRQWPSRRP